MTEDGFSALSACATIEHFPSFWPTKLSFFSCVYDNASRHCSQRNNNNNIRQKKTMHGGYKDNRRRVLTFNTLTAQKRQNMCGDVRVTFSARYWVQVYLAELISDRVSSVEWGAKWGVGPSLFRTYFGRETFGNGLPMVGTYTEILETSWVAMKAIVVDPCIKYS